MKINVLFFGISADLAATKSIDFEVAENSSVQDFKQYLQSAYPKLTKLNLYAIAVNEEYSQDDTILKENDIIAIIPPVSGG